MQSGPLRKPLTVTKLHHLAYPRLEQMQVLRLLGDWNSGPFSPPAVQDMLYSVQSHCLFRSRREEFVNPKPKLVTIIIRILSWTAFNVEYLGGINKDGTRREERIRLVERESGICWD